MTVGKIVRKIIKQIKEFPPGRTLRPMNIFKIKKEVDAG